MSRDRASSPDHDGSAGRSAASHDQSDPLQQARHAVQLAEGLGPMPGVAAAAQEAITDHDYAAAIAAARAWAMHKPHVELIARSMDPHDDFVARGQALLDRMRPIETKLPRNIFKVGIAELDREDEAEWLAQVGGAAKGGSKSSAYAGLHGKLEGNVGLETDVSVQGGRTSDPLLDLSPGDIARGVLVPPWALSKPVRQRVLGADHDPVMHGVDDVLDGLINDGEYLSGFVVGAVHGTQAAIRDCQNAPIDLIKLIVGELKKFALDKHYDVLVRLRDMIKQAPAALELLGKRWNDDSDRHAQGEFQGEVVGYIGTQLAVLIVTSFAGPLAEAFGPYAGVIRAITAVADPVSVVREVALGVRLSKEAEVALQAARKAQRAEALAADAAQGAAKAEQGAVRAEQAAGRTLELADDGAKAGAGLRAGGVAAEHEAGGAVPALMQDAAKPLARGEALLEGLPADLRGRTRIVESPVLTDSTVLVSYRDGVELVVGAEATPRHVAYHAHTVRLLLRYEGLTGKIRRLIDKVLSLMRVRPGYGTAGFEAELEVQKLTAIRDDLQGLLAKADGTLHGGEAVDPATLRAELESVEAQLAKHEQALGSYDDGVGSVAARGLRETHVRRSDLFINVLEDQRAVLLEFKVTTPDGAVRRWGTATVPLDEAGMPLSGPVLELDATLYTNDDVTRMVIRDGDTTVPATDYAIERTESFYKRRFGSEPPALDGDLAAQNKLNFQREWFKLVSTGTPPAEAADQAAAMISFGKHRAARGYDQFKVTIRGEMEAVDLGPPFGTQMVPTGIKVTAKKPGASK